MAPKRSSSDEETNPKRARGEDADTPDAEPQSHAESVAVSLPVGPYVIETDNAAILAGYAHEEDVALRNHLGEKLTLYSPQRRVGEILFRRSREMLNLSPEAPPSKINFLIIGPAQTEIRDQTIRDLSIVLEDALRNHHEHVVEVVQSMIKRVKNSSSIYAGLNRQRSEVARDFLDVLENHPIDDHVHILIHDEAHWGIESESNINTFLREVLAKVKNHENKGIKPNFLFVKVSATAQALTFAANANATIVRWKAPSTYRHINDVRFINDCEQELMNQQKLVERGQILVHQYSEVLTAWINFLRNPNDASRSAAFTNVRSRFPITYKALKRSVMEGITPEDAVSMEHYSKTGGRHKCLLIRMPNVEQARNLQMGVLGAFGRSTVFECLLYEGSTDATLSQRATGTAGGEESGPLPLAELTTALHDIPAMIIVVDKMQMGSRVPHQTAIFDVRSRYVGSVKNQIKGYNTFFFQDVGRMAGYKSRGSCILTSLIADADLRKLDNGEHEDDEEDNSEDEGESQQRPIKFKFQAIHALINKNPSRNFDEPLYDGLGPYTIILDALPQMGKTGAILSFLHKLFGIHA